MATKVVFVTSTGAVTVPSDFGSLVSVEVIGAGAGGKPAPSGSGGEGGGGGAYSSSTAVTGITAGGTVYVSTGASGASGVAGGDTWFNAASNAAPTLTTQGALAKGGAIGASGTGGLGGASASGVGTTKFSGGNGGGSVAGAFGGGGGAAGPSGAGGAGGAGNSVNGGGGGGGGSNGGSAGAAGSTTGGDGGNGVGGTGGGLKGNNTNGTAGTAGTGGGGGGAQGSTFIGGNGATGSVWTQTSNSATAGPGGGGGGTWYFGTTGGTGGLYGGGGGGAVTGGAGGGGIIVFTYDTTPPPPTLLIASRLTGTGNLLVNGSFDENTSIAPAKFRTTINTVHAGTFDEVSDMIVTNGLLLYVNGSSDVYSGSGTTWSDLSPYNNNATLTGNPTYNAGTGGGSFAFDGSTQYAPVTTALLNTTYTGKTVFFVGRLNAAAWTPGVNQFRAMFGSASAPRNFNFYVYHDTGNSIYFHYSTPGSSFITNSVALNTNTWFIAAVTQDATTSTVYLNGSSIYSVAGQTLNQYANGGQEAVGKADNYWYGDVAVCAVYSRALSAAEILNNYNAFAVRVGLTPTTNAPVRREGIDGTLYVTGTFDEVTGIS
jgi:hypothetical protein